MGDVMTDEEFAAIQAAYRAGEWIDVQWVETCRPKRDWLLFKCAELDVPLAGYYDTMTMTLEPGGISEGAYIISDEPFEPKEIVETHSQYGTKTSLGWTEKPDNYFVVTHFRYAGRM